MEKRGRPRKNLIQKPKIKRPVGRPKVNYPNLKLVEGLQIGKPYYTSQLISLWGMKPTRNGRAYINAIMRPYIAVGMVRKDKVEDGEGLLKAVFTKLK